MCRSYPLTDRDFLSVPGVGSQKLTDYGQPFMAEIENWLQQHERHLFADEAPPPPPPKMKAETALGGTALETLRLFRQGLSPETIASQRNLVISTIHSHLAQVITSGDLQADPRDYFSAEDEQTLRQAAAEHGLESLGKLREALGNQFDYPTLHYFRAFEMRSNKAHS